MPGVQPETVLQLAIRGVLAKVDGLMIWRNHVGAVEDKRGLWHTFGLSPGSADLIGLLRVPATWPTLFPAPAAVSLAGRFIGLETKTSVGRLSAGQRVWHHAVRDMGGFVAVVRSPQEALAAIERARRGARE